jgi:hypothetical protein
LLAADFSTSQSRLTFAQLGTAAAAKAIAKPGSRARQATVLTGLEWCALEVAKADTKQKLEEEKAARKATRKANSGRDSEAGAGGGARSRAQAPVPAAAAAAAAEVDLVDDDDSSAEEPADIAD